MNHDLGNAQNIAPAHIPTPDIHQPNAWIELSAKALNHNIAAYRSLVPTTTQLAAIVKGNAYGHGMVPVAQFLDNHAAIDWLCTASTSEALTLRANNIKKPIAVLSYHDAPLTTAIAQHIDLVVHDFTSAQAVSQAAQNIGMTAHVHIKLDTGLSRLGMRVNHENITEIAGVISRIAQLPGLKIRAIFSHFADAENSDHSFVRYQQELFKLVTAQLDCASIEHFSCTAALGTVSLEQYKLARFGIGLYGLWPSPANKKLLEEKGVSLMPVLTWKTHIIQIQQIPPGSTVGYDRTHVTTSSRKLAVVPIGYADGLDRKLSNRGCMLVRGISAPIVGRVSMNVTVIDITDVVQAHIGDEVIVIGDHPSVHPDTVAHHVGTINYEVVTRISPTISRIVG